jgi:hypothetical protein
MEISTGRDSTPPFLLLRSSRLVSLAYRTFTASPYFSPCHARFVCNMQATSPYVHAYIRERKGKVIVHVDIHVHSYRLLCAALGSSSSSSSSSSGGSTYVTCQSVVSQSCILHRAALSHVVRSLFSPVSRGLVVVPISIG